MERLLEHIPRFSIWLKKTNPQAWDRLKNVARMVMSQRIKTPATIDSDMTKRIVTDLEEAIRRRKNNATRN